MSTTRENPHLFPNALYTAPLENWAAAILRLSSEAEQCFLEQVVHYKALSDMEHEFLLVYASHPSGSKIVLGVDRNAQDSARALSTLPLSLSEKDSSDLAYVRVQVSHDGTPAPILAQHGPHVSLYTITFPPTSSSNLEAKCPPSLVHLTVLLFAIHMLFPSYILLEYQCYFFTHAACLALRVPFGGVVTEHKESKPAATWRGVRVSQYSAGFTALQEMLVVVAPLALQETLVVVTPLALQKMLPVVKSPVLQKMLLRVASRVLQKMLLSITSRVLQKMKMLAVAASRALQR